MLISRGGWFDPAGKGTLKFPPHRVRAPLPLSTRHGSFSLPAQPQHDVATVVILSSYAESLHNFRGDLIRALIEKGWQVYALAPDYDATTRARVEALGAIAVAVPLERNGMSAFGDLKTLLYLRRFMREHRPQLFFGYFMKPVIYGTLAAWLAGVPRRVAMVAGLGSLFTDGDAPLSVKARLLRRLAIRLYGLAFHRASKVIFQNRDDLSLMVAAAAAPADRVVLINGSGVNLERFTPSGTPRGERPVTFIWTGRMLREKGVFEIVEAAEIVRGKGHTIEVLLVGGADSNPGSLREDDIRRWHDEGTISWAGKVDDVRPYLQRSDVFLLPSYYREGVPRSTQEAMASGLAVITTDAPGCRETVVDGVNGFLIPVRSPIRLAEAMLRYVEDPSLAREHGAASRKLAAQKFDVQLINREMLATLLSAEVDS